MEDLGPAISYLTLEKGTPVFAADGEEIGKVHEVVADLQTDIFDGLAIERGLLPGHRHYVDAELIDRIHERGVLLTIDAAAAEGLPASERSAE